MGNKTFGFLAVVAVVAALAVEYATAQEESSTRCCVAPESRPFALSCPPGTNISSIDLTSYGNPTGYCGQWTLGQCHADVSDYISRLCLGKSFCEFLPTDELFQVADCADLGTKRLAAQWTCGGQVSRESVPLVGVPPLSTSGRFIVDTTGTRVKLAGVNWYGGQCQEYIPDGLHVNHIRDIARGIREAGFNVVRLQWSNELVAKNPIIEPQYIAANPQLTGARALDVYTAAVEALNEEGVYVILDNHMSDAGWCCTPLDGNGLWFNRNYTEETFFQHWEFMVDRYKNHANVIAAELRNELRSGCGNTDEDGSRVCRIPTWDGPEAIAWKRASTTAGDRIHRINPNLLVMISGLASSSRLRFVRDSPTSLVVPNKLVYVAHDYSWWHPDVIADYESYRVDVENNWGYIIQQNASWTAPLFVSEFGTCHDSLSCLEEVKSKIALTARDSPSDGDDAEIYMTQGRWYSFLMAYLKEIDVDFATWAWNGSTCKGRADSENTFGDEEGYGIANMCWNGIAYPPMLATIQNIQQSTLFP